MPLTTLTKKIMTRKIRAIISQQSSGLTKIFIPEPFIIDQIIRTQRQHRVANLLTSSNLTSRRQTKIITEGTNRPTANRRRALRHQKLNRSTGRFLFTHETLPIIPNQTIRHKEKERIHMKLIVTGKQIGRAHV